MWSHLRTSWAAAAALGISVLALAGCGSTTSTPQASAAGGSANGGATGGGSMKVGLVLEGPKNDKSFNEAAYLGVLKAVHEHPNLKLTSVLENQETTQQQTSAAQQLAQVDNVVIGTGAQFGPIYDAVASQYPNVTFLTIGGYPTQYHKNVYSLAFDRLAAYPEGALAAALTKSKKIGFVGGLNIPPVTQSLAGVKAAAKRQDPSVQVLSNILTSFNDVASAKDAAAAEIADGADVLIGYVDAGIEGVYEAAKQSGKDIPVFKLDLFDCSAYPNIVGANIGDNTVAVEQLLGGVATGSLKPAGETIFAGLQDPALQRLQLCPKYQHNKKLASLVSGIVSGLNSGQIKPPTAEVNPRPKYPYRLGLQGALQNG